MLYIHAFFIHSFILICQSRELWLLLFSSSLSNLELLLDPSPLPLRSLAWKIHPAEGYIQLRYHPVIIYALMMHYSCSNDDEDNDTHNNNDDDVHVKTPFIHPSIHPFNDSHGDHTHSQTRWWVVVNLFGGGWALMSNAISIDLAKIYATTTLLRCYSKMPCPIAITTTTISSTIEDFVRLFFT